MKNWEYGDIVRHELFDGYYAVVVGTAEDAATGEVIAVQLEREIDGVRGKRWFLATSPTIGVHYRDVDWSDDNLEGVWRKITDEEAATELLAILEPGDQKTVTGPDFDRKETE